MHSDVTVHANTTRVSLRRPRRETPKRTGDNSTGFWPAMLCRYICARLFQRNLTLCNWWHLEKMFLCWHRSPSLSHSSFSNWQTVRTTRTSFASCQWNNHNDLWCSHCSSTLWWSHFPSSSHCRRCQTLASWHWFLTPTQSTRWHSEPPLDWSRYIFWYFLLYQLSYN